MNLSAFLAENALKIESVKYVVSKRFLDENGEPILGRFMRSPARRTKICAGPARKECRYLERKDNIQMRRILICI